MEMRNALVPALLSVLAACATAPASRSTPEVCQAYAAERGLALDLGEAGSSWFVTDTNPVVSGVEWPTTESRAEVRCEIMGRRLVVLTVDGVPLRPR